MVIDRTIIFLDPYQVPK